MEKLNWRIIHTHDKQANWDACENFIPEAGEVIIYDVDENYSYERFKVGDGITSIQKLPFSVEGVVNSMFNIKNNLIYADAGRITDYEESIT